MAVMFACTPPQEAAQEPAEAAEPQAIEFGESKYVDLAKQGIPALMNEDLDAFLGNMAEDGIYVFSSGDTIAGKPAMMEYWQGRMDVIESITIENDIWLNVKVNETETDTPLGNWVMGWFDVSATYTSGGSMSQNVHTLYHFNENDQVDITIQYIDRLSIAQAQAGE